MVIGTVIGLIVIVAVFATLGWFINRTQAQSQRRYDQNNMAGTLRTEPYRRPDARRRRTGRRDTGGDVGRDAADDDI